MMLHTCNTPKLDDTQLDYYAAYYRNNSAVNIAMSFIVFLGNADAHIAANQQLSTLRVAA